MLHGLVHFIGLTSAHHSLHMGLLMAYENTVNREGLEKRYTCSVVMWNHLWVMILLLLLLLVLLCELVVGGLADVVSPSLCWPPSTSRHSSISHTWLSLHMSVSKLFLCKRVNGKEGEGEKAKTGQTYYVSRRQGPGYSCRAKVFQGSIM